MLPTNAAGTMTEEKIVVNYYYNQPAKVIVHYVEKATGKGKEIEEINPETGELPIGLILALVALVGLETVTLRYAVVFTKRQKNKK